MKGEETQSHGFRKHLPVTGPSSWWRLARLRLELALGDGFATDIQ
jgi:hypothetical protein